MIPHYIERLLRPRGDGKPVVLVVSDGVLANGETMDYSSYQARYGKAARHEITVRSLSLEDLKAS